MAKSNKDSQGSDLDYSPDDEIAEVMPEDESQKQEDQESQMQDNNVAEGSREEATGETSSSLTGSAEFESGQILEPKVEQCEELMQSVPVDLTVSTGREHETVAGESQKKRTIQETTQMADEAATNVPEPLKKINIIIPLGSIVEALMTLPTESSDAAQEAVGMEAIEEIPEPIEEQQNVPEAERDLEVGRNLEQEEQPQQVLQVQQVEQALELVHEEAVIFERQERMEEAKDIEEPQKYAFREKDSD